MAQRTDPCFLTDKRGEQIMKDTTLVIMAAGIGSRFVYFISIAILVILTEASGSDSRICRIEITSSP